MSTTFTRGPWTVLPPESDKDYVRVRGTHLGSRYKVANVHDPLTNERPETNANATLIAAAPELLAALQLAQKTLIKKCEQNLVAFNGEDVDALTSIEAAIDKATGVISRLMGVK